MYNFANAGLKSSAFFTSSATVPSVTPDQVFLHCKPISRPVRLFRKRLRRLGFALGAHAL
jgi:hypothetical protein